MSLYRRPGSPFWWIRLPRPRQRPLRESTKIAIHAATAPQRQENKQLAERVYHARLGDLARARHALPAAAPGADGERLETWLTWYEHHVTSTHRGADREREILRRLRADFGGLRLPDVTRTVVTEWMTARAQATTGPQTRRRPISAQTVNREVNVLKAAIAAAAAHGKIPASPLVGMPRLHEVTPPRRLMTRDEERRILAAIRRPDDRALLIMALDTLCRLSDCLDLRRTEDLRTTLWIADPKTGGGYRVPVTPRLRRALDAIPGDGGYYFAHRRLDTPAKSRYAVRQMLERACAKAGVPYGRSAGGITWHWATRRTAATRMLEAGVDLPTVQRAGHWKRPSMVLSIYAESDEARVRQAVQTVGRHTRGTRPRQAPQSSKKTR